MFASGEVAYLLYSKPCPVFNNSNLNCTGLNSLVQLYVWNLHAFSRQPYSLFFKLSISNKLRNMTWDQSNFVTAFYLLPTIDQWMDDLGGYLTGCGFCSFIKNNKLKENSVEAIRITQICMKVFLSARSASITFPLNFLVLLHA